MPKFNEKQWAVVRGAGIGLVTTILFFYFMNKVSIQWIDWEESPFELSLRWLLLPLFSFLFAIMLVANSRFFSSAIDPINGEETPKFKVLRNFLQNTLEQFILFFVSLLILGINIEPESFHWVPSLCIYFVIARAVFLVGYLKNPMSRAMGMFMGELVSVGTFLWAAYSLY